MAADDSLILMCKAPVPGKVKTRMCPPLTPRQACGLYTALLEDAAEEAASVRGVRRYLFFSPPGATDRFLAPPFAGFLLREQRGNGLGERMSRAMDVAFAGGARRTVMIGADCPALTAGRIRSAFRELTSGAGAVFGPAEDGGFYLVGLSGPAPSIFLDIEWGTPSVLAAILSRCRNAGIAYALLQPESDVDTADDIGALRLWMDAHPRPRCPRTRNWISARTASLPRVVPSSPRKGG